MTQTETWTIGRLLTWTTDYLKQQGSQSPRLDAEVLLATARGCQRIELYTAFEQEAEEAVRSAFRALVKRRAAGEPVAYLAQTREFYSLPFHVSPDVLIPRPETEFLVIEVLDWVKQQGLTETPLQLADVGTGSGVIAICCAKHLPAAQVTAIDISGPALAIARRNADRHKVADRVQWLESDLLTGLPDEARFDVIASNPPYVSAAEYDQLSQEVRQFEPRLALWGGSDGTEIIQRLITQAAPHLRPAGLLAMEISPMIETLVRQLLDGDARFENTQVANDLAGHARVVTAQRSGT